MKAKRKARSVWVVECLDRKMRGLLCATTVDKSVATMRAQIFGFKTRVVEFREVLPTRKKA